MCIRDRYMGNIPWRFSEKTSTKRLKGYYFLLQFMQGSQTLEKLTDLYQHVPPVKIDDEGRFKYIIINAFLTLDGRKKTGDMIQFIRGTARKAYHPDIFEEFVEEVVAMPLEFKFVQDEKEVVKKAGSILRFECPGGGRIEHSGNKSFMCKFIVTLLQLFSSESEGVRLWIFTDVRARKA
eukprot:TRINITY_DN7636_c0_g2_i2.p1 TRINITY_DN7636_c0_g2~~TRINITY_DN7636_c0_g2_i2.p1  ORF type:complete len:180 (+),score=27.38 TRINITY_DN7636_c0_g2_i2:65-604(+)